VPLLADEVTVAQVWSPRKYVVLLAVPVARRAVATVPELIFEALISVNVAPFPEIVVPVITLPAKEPLASRRTIVKAVAASVPVVLALAMVPLEILLAFIAVNVEPLPDTEVNEPLVAVTTLAAKEPFASRAIIVLAPLAEAAVVRALSKVPEVTLEALIAVSEDPFPEILVKVPVVPVTTFPAKEPLESLATIVEAPFADAAVVLALSIVPLDMLEALIAVRAAPLPEIEVEVIAPALNSPEAPLETIVFAPLDEEAVVRALSIVPLDMLDALIAEIDPPPPLKFVAVITFPENDPLASRATIVLAPLAEAAVVRALSKVPEVTLEALIAVREAALPEILVNVPVVPVITFPAKEPSASRTTRVEAPLAEEALVLALSKVPVVIAVALIAVMEAPLPEKDVPVIAPAANSPEAPRRTIVEAPLAVAAVVLAFAIVPEAILDALIFEPPDRSPITAAVTVAAAKLPPASLATIVDAPLAELALDVTVNVLLPD
jgi:hypothetical protein